MFFLIVTQNHNMRSCEIIFYFKNRFEICQDKIWRCWSNNLYVKKCNTYISNSLSFFWSWAATIFLPGSVSHNCSEMKPKIFIFLMTRVLIMDVISHFMAKFTVQFELRVNIMNLSEFKIQIWTYHRHYDFFYLFLRWSAWKIACKVERKLIRQLQKLMQQNYMVN